MYRLTFIRVCLLSILVVSSITLILWLTDGWSRSSALTTSYSLVIPAVTRSASARPGLNRIQHFVFIMQENRSFDSYFGTYPGATGLPDDVCLPNPNGGPCVAPYHDASAVNHGGPHDWPDGVADIDNGKMDGFLGAAIRAAVKPRLDACHSTLVSCTQGTDPRDVMGWHDERDIPNYWNYAHLFVLQDHMFASVPSFTLPNRLFSLAGQSNGYLSHGQTKPDNFNYPEITQVLSRYGVDWKAYVTVGRQPNSIDGHVLSTGSPLEVKPDQPSYFNPLPSFPAVKNNPEQLRRLVDTAQFYEDAQTGHLPQVCWVIPSEPVSEHPPSSVRKGMAYVTGLVNAVMSGPDWSSTAIFVSYDEWGGFYDHVVPPRLDGETVGMRVPGLVISPFAKHGYIDHHVYTPMSWLKIVEERFALPSLTARDAASADMTDAFDFNQPPRRPILLSATADGTPYPVAP
jgi:phospholipase C